MNTSKINSLYNQHQIDKGNSSTNGSNTRTAIDLYCNGWGRMDYDVFHELYGIHSAIV